jgi:magnesium transporter
MPISFVAGFFGMNFFQPTAANLIPWTAYKAFVVTLMVTVLTPVGMYFWMRKRKWM